MEMHTHGWLRALEHRRDTGSIEIFHVSQHHAPHLLHRQRAHRGPERVGVDEPVVINHRLGGHARERGSFATSAAKPRAGTVNDRPPHETGRRVVLPDAHPLPVRRHECVLHQVFRRGAVASEGHREREHPPILGPIEVVEVLTLIIQRPKHPTDRRHRRLSADGRNVYLNPNPQRLASRDAKTVVRCQTLEGGGTVDGVGWLDDEDGWLIGGREPRPVVIAEYDPTWPERFEHERAKIAAALPQSTRIEHIGSTSVPGLAAKPVIDIIVDVPDIDAPEVQTGLEAAGYQLRVREIGHRMYRTPALDVHVHMWTDPAQTERHLVFRDWLRVNDDDRNRYETVKRELATKTWADMNDYADAKGPVITDITARANAWARITGSTCD